MGHFTTSHDKPVYTDKQYNLMIEALENKGFKKLTTTMWVYRAKNNKFITVRIDFAGFIIVNFNGKLQRSLTPQQVIEGTNYLNGKEDHKVFYLP